MLIGSIQLYILDMNDIWLTKQSVNVSSDLKGKYFLLKFVSFQVINVNLVGIEIIY